MDAYSTFNGSDIYSKNGSMITVQGVDIQDDVVGNFTSFNGTSSEHGPDSSMFKKLLDVFLPVNMFLLTFAIGTTIDIRSLKQTVRRPFGPLVGMVSQFVILPASAFGMAYALQLDAPAAIGLLVIACCPGGALSNICAYWIDGNVALSLTMTVLSTLLAIGVMPLNLWIYSRVLTDSVVAPYVKIVLSLVILVVPASIGIFVRWKWTKFAKHFMKLTSVFGLLIIIVTMVTVLYFYRHMFHASWKLYVAGTVLPLLGLILGYILAKICRLDNMDARTVSLETGMQNVPLAVVIIMLSFPDKFEEIAVIPSVYAASGVLEIIVILLIYQFYKRYIQQSPNNDFEAVGTTEV